MDLIKDITMSKDELYMREALKEAEAAAEIGEVPVGAVVVKDGSIIARAHNMVETNGRSGGHAEMLAIEEAEKAVGGKWLSGCSLYVTLEPCSMCAGAMVLARIENLYIGAMDIKNGACGSVLNVACNERLNHRINVGSGILEEECAKILKDFFREIRISKTALKRNKSDSKENYK